MHRKNTFFDKTAVFLLGLLLLLTACGGGGGSGGDDDEDTVEILDSYHFHIGGALSGNAGQSTLEIEQSGEFILRAQPDVRGSIDCDQSTDICDIQSVSIGSSVLIEDLSESVVVDDINIAVSDTWVFSPPGSDRPVSGGLRIEPLDSGADDIFIEIANCDGSPGTEILVNETDCYSWDSFENLVDHPEASTLQQIQASLGWGAIEFTLEQAAYSMLVFPLIDEDIFAYATAYYESCDTYSATWNAGPPNPGGFLLEWMDDQDNGSPGPGDSFRLDFQNCWYDDQGDNIDTLLNGIIDFVGYTEVVQNNVITRIGFEAPAVSSGKIGGVAYGDEYGNNPLVISETIEEDGEITVDSTVTLSGRYLIVFEQ
jgi:hypothetical protein